MTKQAKSAQIAVRLDPSQLDELDELAAAMAARGFGVELTRAAVARVAMMRGVKELRAELLPERGRTSKAKRK